MIQIKVIDFGIGLSIVKNAVKFSGGEIKFESVVNKGTTFIINLKNVKQ